MRTRFFLLISLIFAFTVNGSAQTTSFTFTKWSPWLKHFTNTSSNIEEITAIDWDFGDGTHATDTALDRYAVYHVYTMPGKYAVKLTATYNTIVETCTDTIIFDTVELVTYNPLSVCFPANHLIFRPNIPHAPYDPIPNMLIIDSVIIYHPAGAGYEDTTVNVGVQVFSPISFGYKNPVKYLPYFRVVRHKNNPETGEKEYHIIEWYGKDTIFVIDLQPNFIADSICYLDSLVQFENTTVVTPALLVDSIHWDYGNGDSLWIYNTETESHNGYAVYHTEGTYTVTLTEYYKGCFQSKSYTIAVRENDVGVKQLRIANYGFILIQRQGN